MLQLFGSDGDDVFVKGTTQDFCKLSQRLQRFGNSPDTSMPFSVNATADASPFQLMLHGIRLLKADIPRIFVDEALNLVVSGRQALFESLVANLPWDVSLEAGEQYHVHYDRFSFGDVLAPESADIIFGLSAMAEASS